MLIPDAGSVFHPPPVELVIVGGPQSGARMVLAPGRHRVGSSLSSDVVVLDPSMKDAHFEVDIAASGAATLHALAPVALGTRPRALEAGRSAAVRAAVRLGLGPAIDGYAARANELIRILASELRASLPTLKSVK